jgi:hypothetical protein
MKTNGTNVKFFVDAYLKKYIKEKSKEFNIKQSAVLEIVSSLSYLNILKKEERDVLNSALFINLIRNKLISK